MMIHEIYARYNRINAVQFTGTWKPVMNFLDSLTEGEFKLGRPPPVTLHDGHGLGLVHLVIHGPTGNEIGKVFAGEWLCHASHPATNGDIFFKMSDGDIHKMYDIPMAADNA